MNRIESAFKKNRQIFIGYLMAGHPDLDKTPDLVRAMVDGGADLVEIGIPYSDPLADGPVIQEAGQLALKSGMTVDEFFKAMPGIREKVDVPLIVMAYFSTLYRYGIESFVAKCAQTGIDGLIIPDLPLEEREELLPCLRSHAIALIPLVAPTSKERIKKIVSGASGFVYCVSTLGVTGEHGHFHKELDRYLQNVRESTDLPIAAGFGVSKRDDVLRLAPLTDGVIVGSALVRVIAETDGNPDVLKRKVSELCHG